MGDLQRTIDRLIRSTVGEPDGLADVAHEQADATWRVRPRRPTASPLWVAGHHPEDVTVGFGQAAACIEIGPSQRRSNSERVLAELEAVCVAVVRGGLVEHIRPDGYACRWLLTLPDGRIERGAVNWLLLPMRWARYVTWSYEPYDPAVVRS